MRGRVTERSKNSWSIVLDMGRDPTTQKRKQQWVSVKGTKKDAERKLAELLHQVDTGGYVKPTHITVAERLGHSTIAVTLDTYSHVTPGLQEAASRAFDEMVKDTRPTTSPVLP